MEISCKFIIRFDGKNKLQLNIEYDDILNLITYCYFQDDIMYLYKALETLIASKHILNPLQESVNIEGGYPVSDLPTLITDFPVTASSSEGGATATTIEMVVGDKGDIHDSSDSALNSKAGLRISESVSVSSTAASK